MTVVCLLLRSTMIFMHRTAHSALPDERRSCLDSTRLFGPQHHYCRCVCCVVNLYFAVLIALQSHIVKGTTMAKYRTVFPYHVLM